jgi:hypothetical protein
VDIDEFMKDPWKPFNDMRNTPHECDYDYRVDSSGAMFFEICKLCLDTKGVIEMDSNCKHTWYMREEGIQCTKCLVLWESDERA